MNKEQFSTNFPQLKAYLIDRWNRLTEEDLRRINGRYELFLTTIQDKYGITREEVEEQIRNFAPNLRFDRQRDVILSKKHEEEEASSVGKWLLAAGIPFLFLLGYLGTHYNTPKLSEVAPSSTNQTLFTKAPASAEVDSTLSQNIRKVLLANAELLNDLKDLRIDAANGVVTIYGTVKSEQQKNLINLIVEKINGVIQVNNKVEIKS